MISRQPGHAINQVLKKKNDVATPQEKSELIKEILPILNEVQNPIIQSEYVKIVATALNVDENALQKEVKKADNMDFLTPDLTTSNVTISSSIEEIAQKNLLSLYLIKSSPFSMGEISEKIKSVNFTNKTLIIVKDTIDKLTNTVNNVSELTDMLYVEFVNDNQVQELITDLICISDSFTGLNDKEFN